MDWALTINLAGAALISINKNLPLWPTVLAQTPTYWQASLLTSPASLPITAGSCSLACGIKMNTISMPHRSQFRSLQWETQAASPWAYIQSMCWWMHRHQLSNWKNPWTIWLEEGAWLHPNQKRAFLFAQEVDRVPMPSSWWDQLITSGEKPPGPSADSCWKPPKQLLSLQTADALVISTLGMGAKARHMERGGKMGLQSSYSRLHKPWIASPNWNTSVVTVAWTCKVHQKKKPPD